MEVTHGRGYGYSIQYHIDKIADDNGFQILECNTDKDHIHLLINCSPQHYVEKAYKYRIYPNKKQKEIIAKTFGCCRFVYNKLGKYLFSRKEFPRSLRL
ncbi:helix-turn-helix domain-containing protein [Acetivibrio ethanolgignens]|uniref:helix-turn-helix domain-containing protein n=1 Tax=Acetivibrio ethanolgignens TaxID=290052 RepID=UPI0009F9D22F